MMILNAVAIILLGAGLFFYFYSKIDKSNLDMGNIGMLLSIASLAVIYLVKPSIKSGREKRIWNNLDINEKIRILADELKSGKRFWAIRKNANTSYFFDPVPYSQISGVYIGTDPNRLRELLQSNQIENNVTTEGILKRLGY